MNRFAGLIRRALLFLRSRLAILIYFGREHYCPVCQRRVRTFLPAGSPARKHAKCPVCSSLERHRLDWVFLQQETDLFDENVKRMLHVAPELSFEKRLRQVDYIDYVSADLHDPRAMVQMDITNIKFEDGAFDVIYCSHVLEHVPDDKKAISEFYRVIKPGGWALLQVPITAEKTLEDSTVIEPEERERIFGRHDHVRRCGPDYLDRIRSAGFHVERFFTADVVKQQADRFRMGIPENRQIFFCRKTVEDTPSGMAVVQVIRET